MSDEYAQYGAPHPVYLNVPGNGIPRILTATLVIPGGSTNQPIISNQPIGHVLSLWMDVKTTAAALGAGESSVTLTAQGTTSSQIVNIAAMGIAYETSAVVMTEGGLVIPAGYVIPLCTPGGLLPGDTQCSILVNNLSGAVPVGTTITLVYTTT